MVMIMAAYQLMTTYQPTDSIVQYGDGVFETMLGIENNVHHWDYHWTRLSQSCQRLQIVPPSQQSLLEQLQCALSQQENDYSVIKMVVSRGKGLRAYRSHSEQPCYVQFSLAPFAFDANRYQQGISVRICQTRLAQQPLLAGMKHLNRLEYIMARREIEDSRFDEGLLLDYDKQVIEGLVSNIFIIKNNQLITPPLTYSGVAGTMRAYLLDTLPRKGYSLQQAAITVGDVADADAVLLTNATFGITPVAAIQGISKNYNITQANSIRLQVDHPCCVF